MYMAQEPQVTEALVKWCEQLLPDKCPKQGTPLDEIWMAAGAARVVARLRFALENQRKDQLDNVL